jgi:iodotyrosine deiodinase
MQIKDFHFNRCHKICTINLLKTMENKHIPHQIQFLNQQQMLEKSATFFAEMNSRRSIRFFKDTPIDIAVIENCIATASTAPSGAHKQPWTFCVVQDAHIKKQIKEAAEAEEKISYDGRMSDEWLADLAPIGTDWQKPFLEIAPYLIIVFRKSFDLDADGKKHQNYYVQESVGIACGLLLAALHNAGLATLTHTPSPMNFLCKILNRPENEKPFLLIPVGYMADDCTVPDLKRKRLEEVMKVY